MSLAALLIMSPSVDDGPDLAAALGRRDTVVLDALIDRYGNGLLRYLLHLTGNRATAEDLFQETWLRVFERGAQYDPRRSFQGWLFIIARHLAIDDQRRQRTRSGDPIEPDGGGHAADLAAHAPSPFEAYAARERRAHLAATIGGLDPIYREVLVLRFVHELSLDEIAHITGAVVPTVKSRLYRALDQMACRLGEES